VPAPVPHLPQPFPGADDAEPAFLVDADAPDGIGNDAGLQGPKARFFPGQGQLLSNSLYLTSVRSPHVARKER